MVTVLPRQRFWHRKLMLRITYRLHRPVTYLHFCTLLYLNSMLIFRLFYYCTLHDSTERKNRRCKIVLQLCENSDKKIIVKLFFFLWDLTMFRYQQHHPMLVFSKLNNLRKKEITGRSDCSNFFEKWPNSDFKKKLTCSLPRVYTFIARRFYLLAVSRFLSAQPVVILAGDGATTLVVELDITGLDSGVRAEPFDKSSSASNEHNIGLERTKHDTES